jgi:anti-sigma B factor antagonist
MNRLLSVEDGEDSAVIRFVPRSVSLDAANVEVVAHLLTALLDGQTPGHLVIDFGPVVFLTSEALGVLLSLHKRVASTGGRLTLLNLREEVYEVFEVTKLNQILRVCRRDGCDHAEVQRFESGRG